MKKKKELADLFKVLSDPNRLEMIELLLHGETCGCRLIDTLDITQPTLSYHLKMIHDVGLSTTSKEGNRVNHYINRDQLDQLIEFLTYLRDLDLKECDM